ncbi:RimK family alpha-L-glutamate ligase [Sanguibacter sp. HDW7]|uniref:ATP-grasp domain-containing protein n=1 Tax=Sanguibacter sp. HDW7 TaxID=2714931 RepID=UPI00140A67C5|nr:hypothetical protein [Sanguibacter sp. HDW7]QIK83130.1 hypothetical protein G7063_05415 [Sanguibacter sp. HDW7]
MTTTRIALATCNFHPDLAEDDQHLLRALRKLGVEAVPAVWDDAEVDWSAFDLVVVRSVWDWSQQRDAFLAWARTVPNLLNRAAILAWNTDKAYLRELDAAGMPTIPTIWLTPEQKLSSRAVHTRMPAHGDFVIKPTVSRGARDTGRYQAGEATSRGTAIRRTVQLLKDGREVMIQRYLTSVDTAGEAALVYIDGAFSHAVRKGAMLQGQFRGAAGLYKQESMSLREVSAAERELADRAVAFAQARLEESHPGEGLLYARVDLVEGDDGAPLVLELEVVEPTLFLAFREGAADGLAQAILARLA